MAIESTGVYWKPVFNILEGVMAVILTKAREAKGCKARKTAVIDAEWLADRWRHGLRKASFIPPLAIREWRELTGSRESLIRERPALANRLQKLVERAKIKLAQVAREALGVSGQLMRRARASGETAAKKMSELARRWMKRQKPEWQRALPGRLSDAQRWVGGELLDRYDSVELVMSRVEARIRQEDEASADPLVPQAVEWLDPIPGVAESVAAIIVAEIGGDRSPLPTARHLASWAGRCRGHNESAGQRKRVKPSQGSGIGERRWCKPPG